MNAKKYNNIKLTLSISKGVITFILLILFVALGYSKDLEIYISGYSEGVYLQWILYVIALGIVSSVIFFPVNFYGSFILEHKYNLSNQNFWQWTWENIKGMLIGAVIGIPLLLLFYFVLNYFGALWWLPFAAILFLVSVVLAQIVPIVILPLFYKITPLDDEELTNRIIDLSKDSGLKVENVYRFNMSKTTKKANAAFTGLGKTKRILLGDTLLESYTKDEIETVIAHELGHYKKKHIVKNIIIGTLFSFLTLFLIAVLYDQSLPWFGFEARTEIAALPLLSLWGMLIGLIQTPISNYISRKYEYEADEYAVRLTEKKNDFLNTLNKLTDQNLGDREPHPFVEWYSYSHPSIKRRTEFIESL